MGTRLRETPVFQQPLIIPFIVGHTVKLVHVSKEKNRIQKQLKMLIDLLTLLGFVVTLM
jgi:ACR3 family arsenite efflux pump ArsB